MFPQISCIEAHTTIAGQAKAGKPGKHFEGSDGTAEHPVYHSQQLAAESTELRNKLDRGCSASLCSLRQAAYLLKLCVCV